MADSPLDATEQVAAAYPAATPEPISTRDAAIDGTPIPTSINKEFTEPINARMVRHLCVTEAKSREREHTGTLEATVKSLRDEIRVLSARSDQLDPIIADLLALRGDVNTLLERQDPPNMALEQDP